MYDIKEYLNKRKPFDDNTSPVPRRSQLWQLKLWCAAWNRGGGGVRYEFLTWRRLDSTRGTDRFGFTRQALDVGRHRCAGMAPLNQTQIFQGITAEMTPTLILVSCDLHFQNEIPQK